MFLSKYLRTLEPTSKFFNSKALLSKQANFPSKYLLFANYCQHSFHERLRQGHYTNELQELIQKTGADSLEVANFLESTSFDLNKKGDYDDALEMALIAKNIYKDKKMSASEFVLLDLISEIYLKTQNQDQAINTLQELINLKETLHGDENPLNSSLYYRTGSLYFHQAKFEDALKHYQKAYDLIRRSSEDEAQKAIYLNYFIALSAYNLSKFEDAKKAAMNALDYYNERDDQKAIYRCSHLLGLICEEMDDLDGGALYFKKALLAAEEAYRPDSYEVALINYLVGKSEYRLDRTDAAIKYTTKSLQIYQGLKNESPLDVADALYNLSLMHYKKQETEEALKHLNEALDLYFAHKNKDDIKIAVALETKGMLLESLERDPEAIGAFDQALQICDAHPERSPKIAKIYYNIARIYSELFADKLDDAQDYAHKALEIASADKNSTFYVEAKALVDVLDHEVHHKQTIDKDDDHVCDHHCKHHHH